MQGNPGPTGATGPTGPQGPQGPAGDDAFIPDAASFNAAGDARYPQLNSPNVFTAFNNKFPRSYSSTAAGIQFGDFGAGGVHGISMNGGGDKMFFQFDGDVSTYLDRTADAENDSAVITRRKGDARYPQKAASTTITATYTFAGAAPTMRFLESDQTGDGAMYSLVVSEKTFAVQRRTEDGTFLDNIARFDWRGPNLSSVESVVTREKGDARYLRVDADSQTSGDLTIYTAGGGGGDVPSGAALKISNFTPGIEFEDRSSPGFATILYQDQGVMYLRDVNGAEAFKFDSAGLEASSGATAITRGRLPFVCPDWFAGANDGAKIQAAIDSLPSTGGTVFLFGRTYSCGQSITVSKPVRIMGAYGDTTGSVIRFSNSSHNLTLNARGASIEALRVENTATGGTCVRVTSSHNHLNGVTLVKASGGTALYVNNSFGLRVRFSRIQSSAAGGTLAHLDGRTNNVEDAVFHDVDFGFPDDAATGWHLDLDGHVRSIKFSDCATLRGEKGIYIRNSASTVNGPKFVYWTGGGGENLSNQAIDIREGDQIKFANAYFDNLGAGSSATADIAYIVGAIGEVGFANCEIRGGGRDGIRFADGHLRVTGCVIGSNGAAGVGAGIYLASPLSAVITGNRIGTFFGGGSGQDHGINHATGTEPVIVAMNDLRGNGTAAITGGLPVGSTDMGNLT